MDSENFAERVGKLIGNESERSFAQRAGISAGGLRALLKGGKPTLDTLLGIARSNEINLDWLATGEGPMRRGDSSQVTVQHMMPATIGEDFVLIPRLDVQASAGNGAVAMHEEALDFLAFQASWLRARNINPAFAQVLTARGDSMEPTVRDGDVLLVDTSITMVRDNALYIVIYDGMVVVKRVHKRLDGSVLLISDNERYPAEDVPAHRTVELHIAGRVVWFGRTI